MKDVSAVNWATKLKETLGIKGLIAAGLTAATLVAGLPVALWTSAERREAKIHANEIRAQGSLRTIATAQVIYREADKDGNGRYDFAQDMLELTATGLVDAERLDETASGYRFRLVPCDDVEFQWKVIAEPAVPGVTGTTWFSMDQGGVATASQTPPL
jgi:hypothetical protein